jgi:hypothetical protein
VLLEFKPLLAVYYAYFDDFRSLIKIVGKDPQLRVTRGEFVFITVIVVLYYRISKS